MSLSARRAWIEINKEPSSSGIHMSLSARRAWIEIASIRFSRKKNRVALRKESVDRNDVLAISALLEIVALRKESVDRNSCWVLA